MAESSHFLTAPQVRARYGGVTEMTLWRWRKDTELGFPQPTVIRGRNYWRADHLDAWDRQQAAKLPDAA